MSVSPGTLSQSDLSYAGENHHYSPAKHTATSIMPRFPHHSSAYVVPGSVQGAQEGGGGGVLLSVVINVRARHMLPHSHPKAQQQGSLRALLLADDGGSRIDHTLWSMPVILAGLE